MQALLASPSTYYDSPDSSFESSNGSSEGHSSPRLPALSSPFSATAGHSMAWDEDEDEQDRAETDTPTKSGVGAQPAWLTEELEEEWVEQPAEEEDEAKHSPAASSDQDGSVRQSSTSGSTTARVYSSLNKPRVPSSLRYGFTSPSAADLGASTSVAQQTDSSVVFGQPSPNSSSAGTFVVKSNPSTSRDSRPGEENQLQAAVRALKGPSAGLGGQTDEGDDSQGQEDGQKSPRKVAAARLGLLSLFEPPSPRSLNSGLDLVLLVTTDYGIVHSYSTPLIHCTCSHCIFFHLRASLDWTSDVVEIAASLLSGIGVHRRHSDRSTTYK